MYVSHSVQGVLDFIANCLAGKELYKNGAVQATARPFPQVADTHSTSQLQISEIHVYCPDSSIFGEIISCTTIELNKDNINVCSEYVVVETKTVRSLKVAAHHILAKPKPVTLHIHNRYPERNEATFGAVIHDLHGYINAQDCTFVTESVYNLPSIYTAARHVIGNRLTQYSPIYCESRGWALQIARQTHPTFSTAYRGLDIPLANNKIITIASYREQEICKTCGSRTVGKLYTIGSKIGNIMCGACVASVAVFETVYAHQCGTDCSRPAPVASAAEETVHTAIAPPDDAEDDLDDILFVPQVKPEPNYSRPAPILALPEELLLAPAKKVGEYLVSEVADKTYIGISNLEYYLKHTEYAGIEAENPVLYYVHLV